MREGIRALQAVWLARTGLTNLNSGEGGSNLIDLKKYRFRGRDYPYVSGQAMRFYLKEALRRHLRPEEACVPDDQGESCGRIRECVLCDLFGFMWTERSGRRGAGRSHIRTSPVKVSPAMGLLPLEDGLTLDLLTRRPRKTVVEAGEEVEARAMVNVELTVNLYKAGVCVDLERVGREEEPETLVEAQQAGRAFPIQTVRLRDHVEPRERDRRVRLLLEALLDFSDYSKQARLLTDFTPELILVALQSNYSHRLQKAFETEGEDGRLDVERLRQVLRETRPEVAVVDGRPAWWAGVLKGAAANGGEVEEVLREEGVPVLRPRQAVEAAIQALGL